MDLLRSVANAGGSFLNNLGGLVKKGKKKLDEVGYDALKAAAGVQSFLESNKSIDIPNVPKQLDFTYQPFKSVPFKIAQDVKVKPLSIARDIANVPFSFAANTIADIGTNAGRLVRGEDIKKYQDSKSPATKLGLQLGSKLNPDRGRELGVPNRMQDLLADVAGVVEAPLSIYGGGRVLGMGKTAFKEVASLGLKETIKKEAALGGKLGGVYGFLSGLAEGRDDTQINQLLKATTSGIIGTGTGIGLGGGIGVLGGTIGAVRNKLVQGLMKDKGLTEKEAQTVVKNFARDEAGRFTGVKLPKKKDIGGADPEFYARINTRLGRPVETPIFHDDMDRYLRTKMGLPASGKYDEGKVDLDLITGGLASKLTKKKGQTTDDLIKAQKEGTVPKPDEPAPKIEAGEAVTKENAGDVVYLVKQNLNAGKYDEAKELFDQLPEDNPYRVGMQSFFDKFKPAGDVPVLAGSKEVAEIAEGQAKLPVDAEPAVGATTPLVAPRTAQEVIAEASSGVNQSTRSVAQPDVPQIDDLIASTKGVSAEPVRTPPTEGAITAPPLPAVSTPEYIKQQAAAQKAAAGSPPNIVEKTRDLGNEIKRKVVDFTAPIEDRLNAAQKQGKYEVLPAHNVRYQIDKALRSDTLATQFIKDNGLEKVIQQVDDPTAFNQYLIAKRAIEVANTSGKETGRDLVADQKLVSELAPIYEPFAQQVRDYNRTLMEYKMDTDLIPRELGERLLQEYPDYVPLQRVFDIIEEEAMRGGKGKGGVASISTQSVLKKLKGSEREIKDPLETIIENTAVAFREGERNKAAKMLVGYKDLPGNPFELRALEAGETATGKNTVSAFFDGRKVTFETLPDVAQAAKNLNSQQLNVLGKILSVPTRALQMGAVGLNLPFVVSNLVRDQISAGVISKQATKTSLLNPLNFVKAFYSAFGKGQMYDDWVRSGSSFTQFDIARGQVQPTIERIRAGKDVQSRIAYKVTHPTELFRAAEDIIGKAEQIGRIQQYGGTREALLGKGRTAVDADILAGEASRNNTANFGRRGEWGRVLNGAIPFFNAGIQGARSLVNAFKTDPKGTTIRFTATIGVPTVSITLWNISDEARRNAYNDIPEYEKENNLIILPPVPTKDENGNYNAIKIPITPGLANLMSMVRRQVEGSQEYDVKGIAQMATDVFQASTSIDPGNLLSSFTPQAIKPFIEDSTNTNLFTGQKIVPEYMKSLPAEQQVKDDTTDIAKTIGGILGVSPLRVENFVSTAFAGVGRQVLGKASIPGEFDRRFFTAKGGDQLSKVYDSIREGDQKVAGVTSGDIDQDLANYARVLKFEDLLGENPNEGIKAKAWDDDRIAQAKKIYAGEGDYAKMPEEVRQKAYEAFGLTEEDVEYDYSASQTDRLKSEYLIEEFSNSDMEHNEMIAALAAGRKESLSGKLMVSNGVIDDFYDEGLINSAEKKALKAIKLNKEGEAKAGSGAGAGTGKSKEQKAFEKAMKDLGEALEKPVKLGSVDALIKESKASAQPYSKIPSFEADVELSRGSSNKLKSELPEVKDLIAKSRAGVPSYDRARQIIASVSGGGSLGDVPRTISYGGRRR